MQPADRRALAARLLIVLGIAAAFGCAPGAPAFADDPQHGNGQVTISVDIAVFDPCAVGAPGCSNGGGGSTGGGGGGNGGDGGGGILAMTGSPVAIPLPAGLLLLAFGAGAVVSRRRDPRKVDSDQG